PAAKYSPPALVSQRPAALLSPATEMPSSSECSAIRLRTLRPHRSASSAVCEAAMMAASGLRARYHGGNSTLPYVDLAAPGGRNSARRSISPLAIASSSAMISSWWRAGSYPLSRHHSVRLARIRRRRNSSAAACAGDICKLIVAQLLRGCFARHLDLATVAPVLGARVLQGEDCACDGR